MENLEDGFSKIDMYDFWCEFVVMEVGSGEYVYWCWLYDIVGYCSLFLEFEKFLVCEKNLYRIMCFGVLFFDNLKERNFIVYFDKVVVLYLDVDLV